MAASSAMIADRVSAGVWPGTTIMSRPTEHTAVMASSLSMVMQPISAASIIPMSTPARASAAEATPGSFLKCSRVANSGTTPPYSA